MIYAIGTDMVEIERIRRALARTPRLPQRILTPAELNAFQQSAHPERFLAKRFAAKEAAVKALGTGIGRGISWQHFSVLHDPHGRPRLQLTGAADALARRQGIDRWHLSLSDERALVVAFVVAESG
jgi:holo-[acyl-carrier protein] synthase